MSQIRRKGTPYIMEAGPVTIDLKNGEQCPCRGTESAAMSIASREMGHYHGLPIQGGGSFPERGIRDAGVGWWQMLDTLTPMLSGGNAGAGPYLEACVLADELVGMLKAMMRGVVVDDVTLALDMIRDVGPGGDTFLGHPHTWMHFREHWQPTMLFRGRYEEWEAAGSKSVGDLVTERLRHIRDNHQPRPIPEKAKAQITAVIERASGRAKGAGV